MTNKVMFALLQKPNMEQLGLDQQQDHYPRCAQGLIEGVVELQNTTGLSTVLLFSDVPVGCRQSFCGYTEFDGSWERPSSALLRRGRETASALLEAKGWRGGDQMVIQFLQEQPLYDGSHLDQGLVGIIIQELSVRAPAF